jgi:hypothetical protein
MINPQACVSQITLNNPDLAVALLDVLTWMTTPNVADSAEYDEIVEYLYAKTPDSRRHMESYLKSRAAA